MADKGKSAPENVSAKVWNEENMVWNRIYYGHDLMQQILENIEKKHALLTRHWSRYLLRAVMAGVIIGLMFVFAAQVKTDLGAEFNKALSGLLMAGSFSWALVFIFFTNSELLTSNFMYFTVGQYYGKIRLLNTLRVLGLCLLGNLLGCFLAAGLVWSCQMLSPEVVQNVVNGVNARTIGADWWPLFVKGIFANFFINIAIIIAMLLKDGLAKVVTLMVGVIIFAYMGYEHVIANSAMFAVALFFEPGQVELWHIAKNFLCALLGNYVGGGVVVGLFYAYLNDSRRS